jgi:hypothetical protein
MEGDGGGGFITVSGGLGRRNPGSPTRVGSNELPPLYEYNNVNTLKVKVWYTKMGGGKFKQILCIESYDRNWQLLEKKLSGKTSEHTEEN